MPYERLFYGDTGIVCPLGIWLSTKSGYGGEMRSKRSLNGHNDLVLTTAE